MITGPTASGKTGLAIDLAKTLGCEIISADSRQIYKGIPITTAVPSAEERHGIKHHLLEFAELSQYYSAAQFAGDATEIIRAAALAGKDFIIVCGGSMMYVDALLDGMDELPAISAGVRERVSKIYNDSGLEAVSAFLSYYTPDYAEYVDATNPRRVLHALELCMQSEKSLSELFGKSREYKPPFDYTKFIIDTERHALFERINRRVDQMVSDGMEREARGLYSLRDLNSLNTIGFKEWFSHFDGKMERPTTIERIKKNTRVYAKKQMTWLNKDSKAIRISLPDALDRILSVLSGVCPRL